VGISDSKRLISPDAEIWALFVHNFKTFEGFKVASKEVNKVINNDSPDTPNQIKPEMRGLFIRLKTAFSPVLKVVTSA
jgi:hypothetical protein